MDVAGLFPGSHRWGLLDGARDADANIRMEEDVEARGTPVAIPLKPGGALFMSNLTVHSSKLNTTRKSRWSIDFRYLPTPDRADLTVEQREAAEFVWNKNRRARRSRLSCSLMAHKPTWEEWEAEVSAQKARR